MCDVRPVQKGEKFQICRRGDDVTTLPPCANPLFRYESTISSVTGQGTHGFVRLTALAPRGRHRAQPPWLTQRQARPEAVRKR